MITDGEITQLCTFMVDDMLFGVDVKRIQEVIRSQEMTPVPLAPEMVRGLINLRGQIVTALDLRLRLGLAPRAEIVPMNVVVRREDGAISLLVDEIGDVVEVSQSSFEPPPETLAAEYKPLIRAVCKLETRLLLLLDTDLAVRVQSRATEGNVHV